MSQPIKTTCGLRRGELICNRRDDHNGLHYDYWKDALFDEKGNEQ